LWCPLAIGRRGIGRPSVAEVNAPKQADRCAVVDDLHAGVRDEVTLPYIPGEAPSQRLARAGRHAKLLAVEEEQFWTLMESAVTAAEHASCDGDGDGDGGDDEDEDGLGGAIAQELATRLAAMDTAAVLGFDAQFRRASDELNRWDVWAAAYLINGGCGDDSFIDFRTGIITLGRDWHSRVVDNPDALADHPAIREVAAGRSADFLFPEAVNYVAVDAFEEITGDDHAYYDAVEESEDQSGPGESEMGENFDFDDPEQMRRRLPRLVGMFLDQERS